YRLLAYTGIGMVYLREQDMEKAEYYFNKIFDKIYYYPTTTTEEMWRVLNVVFHCGEFYAAKQEYDTSNTLLDYIFSVCTENHTTYFLARSVFQKAKNAIAQKKSDEYIYELLQDSKAYAKINRNQH